MTSVMGRGTKDELEVYHWEPNAACARVLICLTEMRCRFTSHYVDVLRFEQHRAAFLRLNERGEVPVLVHHGVAYTEASCICEYLEERALGTALMPADPHARWRVRGWQKYVDDLIAPSVAELAWQACGAALLREREAEELTASMTAIPAPERREQWRVAVTGLSEEVIARARVRVEAALERVQLELQHADWLVGEHYSLADIAAFAYLNYLPGLWRERVNPRATPRLSEWLQRVVARPAVRAALALGRHADAYAVAAPGPEQIRWG